MYGVFEAYREPLIPTLKEESLQRRFNGNPTQMIKGYVHENLNRDICAFWPRI